ncbi:MAG: glycosyltransferase family 4 protein [Planctomycetes bacterium]|nr:glycosyltransferase family 4 protein [Planctomycetota bacterium]
MRLLLVTPSAPPAPTGNATTVGRYAAGLEAAGVPVRVVDLSRGERPLDVVRTLRPDLVLAYHAGRAGPTCLDLGLPLAVQLPGTDVHHDLDDAHRRPLVLAVLGAARRILATSAEVLAIAEAASPGAADRSVLLPRGVRLEPPRGNPREDWGVPTGAPLFLLPAGLRPVKGNLDCLGPLERLRSEGIPLRFVSAGPTLDEAYGREFLRRVERLPWALHAGVLPPPVLAAAYRAADVVLNTSRSEGTSNAVLEAMSLGRAVLVRDVPGNRVLVHDGEDGLLYRDEEGFLGGARALAASPGLRERLGAAAAERARRDCDPGLEIAALRAALVGALGAGPRPL